MKKVPLIVEKSKDCKLWGRIEFNDDLIVDSANSLDVLERKLKKLLQKSHQLEPGNLELELLPSVKLLRKRSA